MSGLPVYEPVQSTYTDDPDDQYKTYDMVAACEMSVRQMFIRKVYSLLSIQIVSTVLVGSVIHYDTKLRDWCLNNMWFFYICLFGSIGLLVASALKARSYPTNLFLLASFTFCEAFTIGFTCSFIQSDLLIRALVLTLFIFIGLTAFAFQTKYDFTSYQGVLSIGLWVLIGVSLIFMFFPGHSKTSDIIYATLGAIIFSGYVVVDTQLLMKKFSADDEIIATITLYLDVVNLFMYILSILNLTNDD